MTVKKEIKNKPWLVFDCETDSFDGEEIEPFIFAAVHDDGTEFLTYSKKHFIDYISNFEGIALAHNGGKFDTLMLCEGFNIGQEIKIINGRVAEVKIGAAVVRDSFLIIPSALKNSGLKDEFDYSILNRNKKHLRQKHKKEIEKYLMQDCYGLHTLVKTFYEKHGQRLTQAGAALAVWENDLKKFKRRWGGAHDALFRRFYYGGRCQAFQKGPLGNGWQYYDIKSAYPFAMLHEHSFCHMSDYNMHNNIRKITPQSFAKVIASNLGCLPFKGKYVTEYLHHDDLREYWATGWEIIAGLETNTLKIKEATIYTPERTENLSDYVNRFYAEKLQAEKDGNHINRLIAKIFMNSLYGKFGQCAADFKKYFITAPGESKEKYELYQECQHFDILQAPSSGQYFDVALSASITGFARSYLFRQMLKVDNLAYCDTDSIICQGGDFEIGDNLGQWEKVADLNDLHIAGKKLYAGFDGKEWVTAHKGFSSLDTSHEDIIRAARGEIISIKRSAPSINVLGQQKFITRRMQKT